MTDEKAKRQGTEVPRRFTIYTRNHRAMGTLRAVNLIQEAGHDPVFSRARDQREAAEKVAGERVRLPYFSGSLEHEGTKHGGLTWLKGCLAARAGV